MLEKKLKKKNFRILVYVVGCILELLGFGLLFASDKTINFIQNYPFILSIFIIFSGYMLSISMRWIPNKN